MARVIESKTLALRIAEFAMDKKAEEVVIIDVATKVDYTDYLVVCSGGSERQVKNIADEVEIRLKKQRIIPFGIEGESE
ncbi:MAG: ribosome silencing factor, partial [Deltaproteobacteria bacterium]|nr:ribosome silencing factor [Deltaproteobacteria bacterium]